MYTEYVWIVVYGALGAFGFGWGTGANDVGNAFGTSVGAKTLTMMQATIIAAIFEFGGAMVLGRVSTQTIAGGIANASDFADNPIIYAYGMASCLCMGTIWLAVASYYGWNVSSTHSIIGGIIGFAWTYKGISGVNWLTHDPTVWPPYKGILPIVVSWFLAPAMTALAAALIFGSSRYFVLRHPNAQQRAIYVAPPLVLATAYINIYFVLTKGAKKTLQQHNPKWTDGTSAWVAFLIALGLALLTWAAVPWMRKKIEQTEARKTSEAAARLVALEEISLGMKEGGKKEGSDDTLSGREDEGEDEENGREGGEGEGCVEKAEKPKEKRDWRKKAKKAMLHGMTVDIHEIIETDATVSAIHGNAEVFNLKAEAIFAYLQVFSAICVMFAHGAGEVGYMSGPLSSIYDIYLHEEMSKKLMAPVWITFISAFSLVVGLATYGYNITRAMGTQMACLTPSRGFAAELATALVILVCSQWGLPNSSSQCIVGGIVGVGCLEGQSGVNWKFFGVTFASWAVTLVIMGGGTALLFAQAVYAPCANDKI